MLENDSSDPPPMARPSSIAWPRALRLALWALPFALGIGLRSSGLARQVLIGDERWEIAAALARPFPELFQHFLISGANYSPPLAAVHRLMIESGMQPGELALRAPVWICGILLLVGLPLFLRHRLPFRIVYPFAWLLAISPQLVFYSRMVRGYLPLVVLGAIVTWAALRWIETGSRRAGCVYAVASGLAVCTHLLALPFVAAPLLYAAGARLWGRRDAPTLRSGLGMGLGVAGCVLLFVGPAWRSIAWLLEELGGQGRPGISGIVATAARLAGVGSPLLGLLFWGVAALGVWRLFRTEPRLAGLGLTQLSVQVLAVSLIGSLGSESEILLTRFVMIALPLLLLFTAAGLSPGAHPGPAQKALSGAFVLAFVLVFYLAGPLGREAFREGSFVHAWAHRGWQDYTPDALELPGESFYASLRQPGRAGPVIETLWHGVAFPDVAPAHQRSHGQPVIVASLIDAWWRDPRLSLRNSLRPLGHQPIAFLRSDARWVVVHREPGGESAKVRGAETARAERMKHRLVRELVERQKALGERLGGRLTAAWGPPDYASDWILAWDLDRIRSRR